MNIMDLSFPISSQSYLPVDHGYQLYSALSRVLPELHETNGIAVHPLRGKQVGDRKMQLDVSSRLVLRVDAVRIPTLIQLAGKTIILSDVPLKIGVPQVFGLVPTTALRSRMVTTKNGIDLARFETEIRRQLNAMNVDARAILTILRRRTLRIREKEIVGHEVVMEGLSAEESMAVQEAGLGGRRHMGCGVFVPIVPRSQ